MSPSGPEYPLPRVVGCLLAGEFDLTRTRCIDHLMPIFRTYLGCRAFASEVGRELLPAEFQKTVLTRIRKKKCDVYHHQLSPTLAARYGLEGKTSWYVKFEIMEASYGDFLTYVSLHQPEHGFRDEDDE